jgi:hypothetical protein
VAGVEGNNSYLAAVFRARETQALSNTKSVAIHGWVEVAKLIVRYAICDRNGVATKPHYNDQMVGSVRTRVYWGVHKGELTYRQT